MTLFLAIFLGALFGFSLNRAGATNPENIINLLRLKDLRLMKTILFAIGFSSTCLFLSLHFKWIDPSHISINPAFVGVIVGGLIFGVGFALAGYCPGTSICAAATGRKDALFFMLGGIFGSLLYTFAYEWLLQNTPLYDQIFGGAVTLAPTLNDRHTPLVTAFGPLFGVLLGIGFMGISFLIPSFVGEGNDWDRYKVEKSIKEPL